MTNREFVVQAIMKADLSQLDDASLFTVYCKTHDDDCTGCPFVDEYCPAGSEEYTLVHASSWMRGTYEGDEDD